MCLCSLSSGRIERSVSGPQEWRGTWDVGCCKHLQGHTTNSHCDCEDISRAKGSHHWERQGDKMVALYSIVRLRSFSWLLFCSARNWLRWRPALTRTQNFSWYVSFSTVYAVTLFVLFIKLDTGWFLIGPVSVQIGKQSFKFFIQESACFAYFYCFHFGTRGGRMLKNPPYTFRIFLKSCDHPVHRTTWCEKAAVPWSTNGWRLMPEPPSRTTTPPPQEPPGEDFCRTIVP